MFEELNCVVATLRSTLERFSRFLYQDSRLKLLLHSSEERNDAVLEGGLVYGALVGIIVIGSLSSISNRSHDSRVSMSCCPRQLYNDDTKIGGVWFIGTMELGISSDCTTHFIERNFPGKEVLENHIVNFSTCSNNQA